MRRDYPTVGRYYVTTRCEHALTMPPASCPHHTYAMLKVTITGVPAVQRCRDAFDMPLNDDYLRATSVAERFWHRHKNRGRKERVVAG